VAKRGLPGADGEARLTFAHDGGLLLISPIAHRRRK
jgi:hypothetical protein